MQRFLKITSSSLMLLTASSSISGAVTYPEPEISKVMFRVDRLPFDQDRINGIVRNIVTLASKNGVDDQAQLNSNARLLAIAMRLNTKDEEVKKLSETFSKKGTVIEASIVERQKAQLNLLQLIRTLSQSEHEGEAMVLVSYLKDAMVEVAGDHPDLAHHQLDLSRWKHVVPNIEIPPTIDVDVVEKLAGEVKPTPETTTAAIKPPQGNASGVVAPAKEVVTHKWNYLESSIAAPIVVSEKDLGKINSFWTTNSFDLTIEPKQAATGIKLTFKPAHDSGIVRSIEATLNRMLKKKWKNFKHAHVNVDLSESYSNRSRQLGVLPIYAQLNASLRNLKVPANLHMLGELKENETIRSGSLFWEQLHEARKGKNLKQMLICPADAENALKQLVTLEEADFFVRNEVVLVKNVDEAMKYFGEISELDLKFAHQEFVKVRDLIGTRSVGSFSVDKSVIQSLKKVLEFNPNHFSAKMILLRGDSKRPFKIDPYFLAEEFKPLMESLKAINIAQSVYQNSDTLTQKAEQIDQHLDKITRYVDRSEIAMLDAIEEMSDELDNISRSKDRDYSEYHIKAIKSAHERFKKHYKTASDFIKEQQSKK